jgi:hypothetical protein
MGISSNVTFNALYLSGRAFGATGSVNVVFRFGSDEPTTNVWHLTTNLSTEAFSLTNSAADLAMQYFDWGILPGTKTTNSVRVQGATAVGSWQ